MSGTVSSLKISVTDNNLLVFKYGEEEYKCRAFEAKIKEKELSIFVLKDLTSTQFTSQVEKAMQLVGEHLDSSQRIDTGFRKDIEINVAGQRIQFDGCYPVKYDSTVSETAFTLSFSTRRIISTEDNT